MSKIHRIKKKNLIRTLVGYGFHLWFLLFLSNVFILYSLHIISFGATQNTPANPLATTTTAAPSANPNTVSSAPSAAQNPSATSTPDTPIPSPVGPVLDLMFVVPGIGSGGGVMKPQRPTRNVTVLLYGADVNSNDSKIKPLYSINSTAKFETNINDPLYTTFVNHVLDLGPTIQDGNYQIAFKTDHSLVKLIKSKPDDVGGEIFQVAKSLPSTSGLQQVIIGDIYPPQGDNIMDINDYNQLVSCYGDNWDVKKCPNNKIADLNDDGKVDGVDYNIMVKSFKTLADMGIPVPTNPPLVQPTGVSRLSELNVTPHITPSLAPKPRVITTKPKTIVKQSSNAGGFVTLIVFILIIGALLYLQIRNHFFTNMLGRVKPAASSAAPAAGAPPQESAAPPAMPVETTPPPGGDQPLQPSPADSSQAPAAPQADTTPPVAEQPVQPTTDATTPSADQPTTPPSAETQPATPVEPTAQPAASQGEQTVDATYYVKKKSEDEKGTWFTLTGDDGLIEGLYNGTGLTDGFSRIKGIMKNENNKKYIQITEVLPAE